MECKGARKLKGDDLEVVCAEFFNAKLDSCPPLYKCVKKLRPLLLLKTRPGFSPPY
jgi:hypothetical protein